ncbi:hypothetical protein OPV22_013939 [Ensete ventricosum]|uniref:Uncharacterized protein n=1 Tax=Ensete ventricosum TaxID=4639 RepID=A0AAV8PJD9_ENSVE|nr:hypothetical protein OPV22_013939 [Ensete ventricosum]
MPVSVAVHPTAVANTEVPRRVHGNGEPVHVRAYRILKKEKQWVRKRSLKRQRICNLQISCHQNRNTIVMRDGKLGLVRFLAPSTFILELIAGSADPPPSKSSFLFMQMH